MQDCGWINSVNQAGKLSGIGQIYLPVRECTQCFGKSGGLISVLRKIDQKIPLFYFSLEGEPPATKTSEEAQPVSGKWIREIGKNLRELYRRLVALRA